MIMSINSAILAIVNIYNCTYNITSYDYVD